jgi:microcystin-dependent protein
VSDDPYIGQVEILAFAYAPRGWALCNGQLLPINQNQALFSLLGTTYGGNGQTNFALPDLRGKTPLHVGSGHTLGETGGEPSHTLSIAELPTHVHRQNASSANGDSALPGGNILASASGLYAPPSALTPLEPSSIANVGGSQAHLNMQPFLTLTFVIALQGVFPSQNP